MKNKIVRRYIVAAGLAVLIIIFVILRQYSAVSNWIAKNFSAAIISIAGALTSLVPFSIFEWLVVIAIIAVIYLIVKIIRSIVRKDYSRMHMAITSIIMTVLIVINIYMLTASFSYFSDNIDLPAYETKLEASQAQEISDYFLADYIYTANKLTFDEKGRLKMPYSFNDLANKIAAEYDKLDYPYLNKFTPIVKPSVFSKVMSHERILGITFAPLGEIQINADAPVASLATTIAHEIAHIKGVMREDEANMLAMFITFNSDDDFIRFSGYYRFFGYIYGIADVAGEEYSSQFSINNDIINKVYQENGIYWSQFNGFIAKLSSFFNDLYLKLSGIKEGTGSYDDYPPPPTETIIPGDNPGEEIIIIEYNLSTTQKIILQIFLDKTGKTLS